MSDGPVYGDILSAFPELIQEYRLFRMTARAGGGWNPRTGEVTVDGIFRRVPGGAMGIEGENRETNGVGSLYLFADDATSLPSQGIYMEVGGVLYILKKDNGYADEAGYVKFIANLVAGPTDMQTKDPAVVQKARNALQ